MQELFRIAVFYDGQYFFNVSNYYMYTHPRKARISISGLHNFIKEKAAEFMGIDRSLCQIVDAHYFRGRLSARDANEAGKLFNERVFDDILMSENVVTHYLRLHPTMDGGRQEKGVDVWLALEAYELAIYKKYDALVLIACDGDYVPLVRKLNTLGTRVILLGWDFTFKDAENKERVTRTSQGLLEAVTHYLPMHTIIDNRNPSQSVQDLFVKSTPRTESPAYPSYSQQPLSADAPVFEMTPTSEEYEKAVESTIINVREGFGFISDPVNNNVFFHHSNLMNIDFNDLQAGMRVKYTVNTQEDGRIQADKVWVIR
jgi:uncharacterized LabA/DUF88 family protein/cold shock CspA family protein